MNNSCRSFRCVYGLMLSILIASAALAQAPSWTTGRSNGKAATADGYWSDTYDDGIQPAATWPGTWTPSAKSGGTQAPPDPKVTSDLVAQCSVAFKAHQYDRALTLCRRAADMGDREGIEGAAIIYREGLGQCSEAAVYYKMNKDTRSAAAAGLGEMYWLGCRDFPSDLRQARSLLESAAGRGWNNALEDLAWMDELGQGSPQNRNKAIDELKEVARHDNNEWTNDVIVALRQPNAPARFNSAKDLGSYVADVRFYREIARFNQEEQRRLEAMRLNAPPGTFVSCNAFGCRYVDASPLMQTLSRIPGSPWNHSN